MDYPKSVPGVGLVGGKFVDENPATGQQGSLIPSVWGNQVTDELLAVIAAAGLEPREGESDQLLQAFRELQKRMSADAGMLIFNTPGVHTLQVPSVLRLGMKKGHFVLTGSGGSGAVHASTATGGGAAGTVMGVIDLQGVNTVTVTIAASAEGRGTAGNGSNGNSSSFGTYATATAGVGGGSTSGGGGGGGTAAHPSVLSSVVIQGAPGMIGSSSVGGSGGGSYWGGGGRGVGGSGGGADAYGAGGGGGLTGSGFSGGGILILQW